MRKPGEKLSNLYCMIAVGAACAETISGAFACIACNKNTVSAAEKQSLGKGSLGLGLRAQVNRTRLDNPKSSKADPGYSCNGGEVIVYSGRG
jgi:hypothetical protein